MTTGSQERVRLRLRGGRRGGGGGGSWSSGRGSRTVTTGATLALASGIVHDLRDPDGLLRPLLRSAAARLAERRRWGIDRVGREYLRLDPPSPSAGAAATMQQTTVALTGDTGSGSRAARLYEEGASDDVIDAEVVDEDDGDDEDSL
jgi:hypothetical protein